MTASLSLSNEINLILVGATGKLGKSISKNNIVTYGICSKKNPFLGDVIEGIQKPLISSFSEVNLEIVDKPLVIDASYPENLENILEFCLSYSIPLILASTGHTEKQLKKLEKLAKKVPVLKAPNLSVGIAFFKANMLKPIISEINFRIDRKLATSELDIKIIETHHKNKKDSPSGTALDLKDYIQKGLESLNIEIEIESIRDKSSVGKHEVIFKIKNEEFSVSHNALSRDIFGEGISLASHIIDKKSGIYSVSDLIADI